MALKGRAKRDYQRSYMQERRGRGPISSRLRKLGFLILEEHRAPTPSLSDTDKSVLMLAEGGWLNQEIQEALDLSEEALRAALERLGEHLAPTAASQSVDEVMPFDDEQGWEERDEILGEAI